MLVVKLVEVAECSLSERWCIAPRFTLTGDSVQYSEGFASAVGKWLPQSFSFLAARSSAHLTLTLNGGLIDEHLPPVASASDPPDESQPKRACACSISIASLLPFRTNVMWARAVPPVPSAPAMCADVRIEVLLRPLSVDESDSTFGSPRDRFGFSSTSATADAAAAAGTLAATRAQEVHKEITLWQLMPVEGEFADPSPTLRQICTGGLALATRAQAWFVMSGAHVKMFNSPMRYEQLLGEYRLQQSKARPGSERRGQVTMEAEIAKDLARTFPLQPYYRSALGRQSLANVLGAYSHHNPDIGYCQGLNYVAGMLLLLMDEEWTFWMLAVICEDLCPRYYQQDMAGALVDQQILNDLAIRELPEVEDKLSAWYVDFTLITMHWFLCVYSVCYPAETTMRLWDLIFCGVHPEALFAVALASLHYYRDIILEARSLEEISQGLCDAMANQHDAEPVVAACVCQMAMLKAVPSGHSIAARRERLAAAAVRGEELADKRREGKAARDVSIQRQTKMLRKARPELCRPTQLRPTLYCGQHYCGQHYLGQHYLGQHCTAANTTGVNAT